jgi:hypothetical protein
VIDCQRPSSWGERWSLICCWFDLEGGGFEEGAPHASEFIETHRAEWDALATKHGLKPDLLDNNTTNPDFFNAILSLFDFDHHISGEKAYQAGFRQSLDERTSWSVAFQRFRDAKIIP